MCIIFEGYHFEIMFVCLYVDDLIFANNNLQMFEAFKKKMSHEFEMTNLQLMSYYLGIKIKQTKEEIFIT